MDMLKWQRLRGAYRTKDGWTSEKEIERSTPVLHRAKVPGGWMVMMQQYDAQATTSHAFGYGFGGLTFVPDPNHEWDGTSL